jgi:hypothetical protein
MHPTPSHFILEVLPKVGIVTTCECGGQKKEVFLLFYFRIVQYNQKKIMMDQSNWLLAKKFKKLNL